MALYDELTPEQHTLVSHIWDATCDSLRSEGVQMELDSDEEHTLFDAITLVVSKSPAPVIA